VTATEIVSMLNLDKSYLSRMIVRLEKMKIVDRKKSKRDARSFNLYITAAGQREFDRLDVTATRDMSQMLQQLSEEDCKVLMNNMASIQNILSKL
jgi:DNA-binding MarR family transcriptional regulator